MSEEPESAPGDRRQRLIEARLAAADARWGDRLDAAAREEVRRRVATQVDHGLLLRQVPLANGDEPEIVFVPFRAATEAGR